MQIKEHVFERKKNKSSISLAVFLVGEDHKTHLADMRKFVKCPRIQKFQISTHM
jgi:hypothetical protein